MPQFQEGIESRITKGLDKLVEESIDAERYKGGRTGPPKLLALDVALVGTFVLQSERWSQFLVAMQSLVQSKLGKVVEEQPA